MVAFKKHVLLTMISCKKKMFLKSMRANIFYMQRTLQQLRTEELTTDSISASIQTEDRSCGAF